jgi:hypothetical protein
LHEKRDEIDRSLTLGKSQRRVAAEHGLALATVNRHFHKHLPKAALSAHASAETERAGDLLAKVEAISEQQQRLLDRAEKEGDLRTAIAAGRELARCVELTAKLRGDISASTTNINIVASPDFLAIVALMNEFVDPYKRPELAERLALMAPGRRIDHSPLPVIDHE